MNFLLDMGISPRLVEVLRRAGHEAVHVFDIGLGRADDVSILEECRRRKAIAITTDKDFANIVATAANTSPSVITLRLDNPSAQEQTEAILAFLEAFRPPAIGCWLITLIPGRYRFRVLPV